MLLMLGIDVALVLKMASNRLHRPAKPRSAADRMLTSLKAMGDHSLRSTDKDYASADNGEITALSKRSRASSSSRPQQQHLQQQSSEVRSAREGSNGNRTLAKGPAADGEGQEPQSGAIDLNKEKCRSTVMCIVMGLLFIALTLPSAYLRARMSFAEHKGRFPLTTYEIHLMQVLEKVNQFTGLYKVLLYLLFLSSFRRALLCSLKSLFLSRCCNRRRRQFVTTV